MGSPEKIGKRRLQARTVSSAERAAQLEVSCPFCHDTIQIESVGWTCCSLCLGRHHRECWNEHGCCASCGSDKNLTFVQVRSDLRAPRPIGAHATLSDARDQRVRVALIAAGCLAASALGILLSL